MNNLKTFFNSVSSMFLGLGTDRTGPANSGRWVEGGPSGGKYRWFGPDGKAAWDFHSDHSSHHGGDHYHDWRWPPGELGKAYKKDGEFSPPSVDGTNLAVLLFGSMLIAWFGRNSVGDDYHAKDVGKAYAF